MEKEKLKAGLGILLLNKKMLDLFDILGPVKVFTKKRAGMQKLLQRDCQQLFTTWLGDMDKDSEDYFFRLSKLLDAMISLATDAAMDDESTARLESVIMAYRSGDLYEATDKTIRLTNSLVKEGIRKMG